MSARTGCTYVDRQVGQPIVVLGPRDMIGWTFYGPMPSTDNINTFRPLNLVTAIGMWRDFSQHKIQIQITYPAFNMGFCFKRSHQVWCVLNEFTGYETSPGVSKGAERSALSAGCPERRAGGRPEWETSEHLIQQPPTAQRPAEETDLHQHHLPHQDWGPRYVTCDLNG